MKTRAIIVPRAPQPGTIIEDDVLAGVLKDIKAKGDIELTDPDGNTYPAKVNDLKITDRGIEATIIMTLIP